MSPRHVASLIIGSELALDWLLRCRAVADELGGQLGIGSICDHISEGLVDCLDEVGLLLLEGEALLDMTDIVALPPAFPAVRIDGEVYWDGGILSNTPTEVVFDDSPQRSSLIFAVHMWNPIGPEPETIWQILNRQKDIQYSSRVASHIARQLQIHQLRHIIRQLVERLPEAERNTDAVRKFASYGCLNRMHVVRLLAPRLDNEDPPEGRRLQPVRHSPALGGRL
jgi:hypothetical protein